MADMQTNIPNDGLDNGKSALIPEDSYLVLDGIKTIPLEQPIINIGRRLENHIVIEDPRVSRNHVQLRAINGRFVLFDLSSTGGSYVNGNLVEQCVLYPGDEISLAGYILYYRQYDAPPRKDLKETSPLG